MDWPIGMRGLSEEPGSWNTMPVLRRRGFRSRLPASEMS